MPLPLAHALLGATIAEVVVPDHSPNRTTKLLAAAMISVLPDLDFVPVVVMGFDRGIHRGFTHSFGFAVIFGLIVFASLGWSRWREALSYSLAFLSHGILDALTTVRGQGIELLWPLADFRWKLGVLELPRWTLVGAGWHQKIVEMVVTSVFQALVLLPIAATCFLLLRRARSRSKPCASTPAMRLQ